MDWSSARHEIRTAVTEGPPVVAHLSGELDADTVPLVLRLLTGLRSTGADLVVDLSRVHFCDAAGIAALLELRTLLGRQGGRLVFRHPHSSVRRVLRLCGLEDRFTLVPATAARPAPSPQRRKSLAVLLDRAVAVSGSGRGNVQLLDPATGILSIVEHRGLDASFRRYFEIVADVGTSCGAAAQGRTAVFVEDVFASPVFAGTPALDALSRAGVASVASVPVVRHGRVIGVVSTHRGRTGPWSGEERAALAELGDLD